MRNAFAFFDSQLCRADVHAFVQLHGIHIDYFTVKLVG